MLLKMEENHLEMITKFNFINLNMENFVVQICNEYTQNYMAIYD